MHNFAAAQRQYDRRLPAEPPQPAHPALDPMEELRNDLAKRLDAQDIASAVWDRLNDSNADIDMIRNTACGDKTAAMALFDAAIKAVALQRAA